MAIQSKSQTIFYFPVLWGIDAGNLKKFAQKKAKKNSNNFEILFDIHGMVIYISTLPQKKMYFYIKKVLDIVQVNIYISILPAIIAEWKF